MPIDSGQNPRICSPNAGENGHDKIRQATGRCAPKKEKGLEERHLEKGKKERDHHDTKTAKGKKLGGHDHPRLKR